MTIRRAALVLGSVLAAGCAPAPDGSNDPRAEACGECHTAQFSAWSESGHANSDRSPVFEAMLPHVERAWGPLARDRCVSCHSPGHGQDMAIGCVACHAAIGNTAERDGALVVDLDVAIAGPFGDAELAPHATRRGELLASSSLCGTCHEVTGPGLFVELTLTHYRASPAAQMGIGCADCHMLELAPGPIANGATRVRDRLAHTFTGLDPPWGASAQVAQQSANRTRALLDRALVIEIVPTEEGDFEISVINECFAHRVPTGVAMLRDMWVDVYITNAAGDQTVLERVIELGAQPTRDGQPVALPTDADAIDDRGLDPGQRATARIVTGGAVRLEAIARARAFRPAVLDALELSDRLPELPVFDISTTVWVAGE